MGSRFASGAVVPERMLAIRGMLTKVPRVGLHVSFKDRKRCAEALGFPGETQISLSSMHF